MTDQAKERIEKEQKEKTGRLDLSSCELEQIPKEIEKMTWLTELYLGNNQITKIEGLGNLIQLKVLSLDNNQITKIEGLDNLIQLNQLFLNNNQITKIEGLNNLILLSILHLDNNQITKIEGLKNLIDLTELILHSNQISEIEGLHKLTSLTEFYLNNNQITKIEGLDNLIQLNQLYLDNNQIAKIEGLNNLIQLNTLSLSDNKISKIEDLNKLVQLKNFDLSHNQISKIEGLNNLIQLNVLYLHNNQITKIEGLDNLNQLNILSLKSNQISKIRGLDNLNQLNALYLHSNQISKIEGLLALSSLELLFLNNSPITVLPVEYQSFLSKLAVLNLSETKINDLSSFYKSIGKGKKILWEDRNFLSGNAPNRESYFEFKINRQTFHYKKGISVKDCPNLAPELVAAIQNGQAALLEYIQAPKERLFEARVLILGEPRAGKTTLRRKLQHVNKPMPSVQESTKAFEIEIEPYECEIELTEKKEKLRYHLWDFGGQDYYRLLHQLFVAEQSVYIIVVGTDDREKEEKELEFWLDTIERLAKDENGQCGPIILLQNPKNNRAGGSFIDLKSRFPFWQQTEDFTINLNAINKEEKDFFDPSALTAFRGFEKYLSRSFCQLEHIGKEMPVKWIAVREALLQETGNWISVERFNELCTQNGITKKEQRISLLDIFKRLGYLLHYKNTALKGMVILNTEWVADALYRVLDDPIVERNNGWFVKEDIAQIWHEEKYENRTNELLALMQEFKFCYQNPISQKYIVPSKLLSSTDNLPLWDTSNNVRLHLQYNWMPKAIVIQLLVSLHEYIVNLKDGNHWIWRKGAVLDGKQLDLADVQVRIREEYDKRRIVIEGRGAHSEAIIRVIMKKWREVHEPFKDKVEVTPMIVCPCKSCSESKTPEYFKYENVLNAKEKGKQQYCNASNEFLEATAILKGVYDETTILIDSLQTERNKHSSVLDLIKADELDKAIDTISSPEYNTLFSRRLKQLEKQSLSGTLTYEQKNQARNTLAQELVQYFTSNRWQEPYKLDRFGDIFTRENSKENRAVSNDIATKEKETTPVQVIINNTNTNTPEDTSKTESGRQHATPKISLSTPISKPIHQQWWFGRLVGAVIGGGILSYFASKYAAFHFGDTWLGIASLASALLLLHNPKRVYLRWAGFCVMAIASINILSQIDIAFKITNSETSSPWDLFFKLGFGEEPIISVILGILAVVLFVLDYRMRKEKL